MRPRTPSPALIVASIALFVALSGTAFAAVNFARNAGAVDGKSAVASGTTLSRAAGKLVATQRTGAAKGRIAAKYLDVGGLARGDSTTFGRAFEVADNATGAPLTMVDVAGVGPLTASCIDQNKTVGKEDPQTTVVLSNTSGLAANLSRRSGNDVLVSALLPATVSQFTINGSNIFELYVQRSGLNQVIHGVVRQDGAGTAAAGCLVYGYVMTLPA